jgi:hypothetical protein
MSVHAKWDLLRCAHLRAWYCIAARSYCVAATSALTLEGARSGAVDRLHFQYVRYVLGSVIGVGRQVAAIMFSRGEDRSKRKQDMVARRNSTAFDMHLK